MNRVIFDLRIKLGRAEICGPRLVSSTKAWICRHATSLNSWASNTVRMWLLAWYAKRVSRESRLSKGSGRVGVRVFDIVNAGPRHRFATAASIAHNCLGLGYGMGPRALQAFAKTSAGVDLSVAEAKTVVDDYRRGNAPIVKLWGLLDRSMKKQCVQDRGGDFEIGLPSGQSIRYHSMHEDGGIRASKVKGEAPGYWHGGVAVENITQRIARDILANAIANLRAASIPVVLHVHDEVLAEVPIDIAEEGRQAVITAMETLPDWAKGLPLKTDARLIDRYTK